MNTLFKKFTALSMAALTLTGVLTACGGAADSTTTDGNTSAAQANDDDEMYTIGISQLVINSSLDNCREGFIQGLAEAGFVEGENVTFDYQNSQGDLSISQQIATDFVSSGDDLIAAIATPAAQTAFNAAEKNATPVIYVAVSDPVAAGLAQEDGTSGKNVTGVSDVISAEAQLAMIREFLPEAKKIGILYSTSEANSETQLKMYQDAAGAYDFEIVASGIATSADIPLAVDALLGKVDCLNNLTDNTVVASLPTILDKANKAGKPVFGSEVEQVKDGCLASEGIDYVALGKQAGAMAAKVLNGEDISIMPYETIHEYSTDVNQDTLANLNITLPDSIKERATMHETDKE